jgi:hypothetical protein
MEINKIWYGCYAIGPYSKFIPFIFLHSVTPSWQILKLARWGDDAISYDPLRMRSANLTFSPVTTVCTRLTSG